MKNGENSINPDISEDENVNKVLNIINVKLQNINQYLAKSVEDNSRIAFINYSSYSCIREEYKLIEQLENYDKLSISTLIDNDFINYCRYIDIQIEIFINRFIYSRYSKEEIEEKSREKYGFTRLNKLNDFIEFGCKLKSYKTPEHTLISQIINIRNLASHGDSDGNSIIDRTNSIGEKITIYLTNLPNSFVIEDSKKLLKEIFQPIGKINNNKKYYIGSPFIYFYINVKYDSINISKTELLLQNKYDMSEEKIKVEVTPELPNLRDFFNNQDFKQVNECLVWVIEKYVSYLTVKENPISNILINDNQPSEVVEKPKLKLKDNVTVNLFVSVSQPPSGKTKPILKNNLITK